MELAATVALPPPAAAAWAMLLAAAVLLAPAAVASAVELAVALDPGPVADAWLWEVAVADPPFTAMAWLLATAVALCDSVRPACSVAGSQCVSIEHQTFKLSAYSCQQQRKCRDGQHLVSWAHFEQGSGPTSAPTGLGRNGYLVGRVCWGLRAGSAVWVCAGWMVRLGWPSRSRLQPPITQVRGGSALGGGGAARNLGTPTSLALAAA
ncbi:hypothetical protein V8C86DRAFT_2629706 [Haematococcus lacustris]